MNTVRLLTLCTCLIGTSWTHAQRTEIDVHHGTVRAQLDHKSLDIEAGRKVTLLPDGQPTLAVSNPLVDEALTLAKLIEREKQNSQIQIDSVLAMTVDMTINDQESSTVAIYAEIPNPYGARTDTLSMGSLVRVDNFAVYDTDGHRLQVDVHPADTPDHAYYTVHFKTPCPADALMQMIVVATLDKIPYRPGGSDGVWQKGPLWHFFMEFMLPNSLHYYRIILPDSAIYVDSTIPPLAVDTQGERSAVTLRQYTGPHGDGKFTLAFLYPNHDGSSLADLPAAYLEQRGQDERDHRRFFRTERNRILAGQHSQDQSTPITALLSLISAAIHDDITAYGKTKDVLGPNDRKKAKLKSVRYWINTYTEISTQPWPKHPGDGYIHLLYLRRSGTELPGLKQPMIYRNGKWYARPSIPFISNMAQEGSDKPIDEDVRVRLQTAGFVTDWEVTGPYTQADNSNDALFNSPFGPELNDVDVPWRPIPIEIFTLYEQDHAYVNLHKFLDGGPRRVAYLRSTIHAQRQQTQRLDIRSDDGVKVWLNGKQVHANNTARGVDVGPDTLMVELRKGKNKLLVKVVQDLWGWGAIVQLGSQKAVAPTPTGSTWNPNLPVSLQWNPAAQAQSQRVYLGTHREALPLLQEITKGASPSPLSLEPGQQYYWRVDGILADGTTVRGDTWDFATGKQVGWWALDRNLKNRLADTLHGTTPGQSTWVNRMQGQALVLKEDDDYVTLPPLHLNTDTLTVTMWIKTEKIVQNPGLFFTRDGSTCAGLWLAEKNELRYNWNGDMSTWAWGSGLIVPHRQWTFVAMVVDMFRTRLYLHDGRKMTFSQHDQGHGSARFDGDTWIGHDPRWSTFKGAIDDVRLFTYALQPQEIKTIYQDSNPH